MRFALCSSTHLLGTNSLPKRDRTKMRRKQEKPIPSRTGSLGFRFFIAVLVLFIVILCHWRVLGWGPATNQGGFVALTGAMGTDDVTRRLEPESRWSSPGVRLYKNACNITTAIKEFMLQKYTKDFRTFNLSIMSAFRWLLHFIVQPLKIINWNYRRNPW